jgi:EAL domain-containing protein (putative c-di-GMP-specific phosphodiesterase class I)
MLAEVCRQMSLWKDLGAAVPALTIYISGNTLLDADSILRLGQQLLAAKPLPFQLAIGIPEDVLTQNPRAIQSMLARIKARNIRLVLDDFGTGTSALSLLRMMPVSTVRLHPDLAKEPIEDHKDFAAGIVELAHRLQMKVIGSGVGSDEQLARLRESDCDYVQGNYISVPVAESAVPALLEKNQPRWT